MKVYNWLFYQILNYKGYKIYNIICYVYENFEI